MKRKLSKCALMRLNAKKPLTQEEVAEKLNMNRNTYAKKEKGEAEFTLSELRILAKLFDVKFSDFIEN
ncbi:MAG: helix-turn-helix transcriptional regulator [Firmicutes bacterium]|nr:helix-turn-helix transcriptional regulator [Candidatus Colivicinus equi]